MALELNYENFEEIISSDKLVLVDFWAEWCGPCKILGPIIDELSLEYADRAIIGKVNVDSCPDLAMEYGIRNIPTLLLFKNGQIVDRHSGVAPVSFLSKKLEAQLI